jgi:hypothetical protein
VRLSKDFRVAYFREFPDGSFEAVIEVFGVVDKFGDRVRPGAFNESLTKWRESGVPIPLVDSGRVIGAVDSETIREVGEGVLPYAPRGGLMFRGRVDAEYDHIALVQLSLDLDTVKEKRAEDAACNICVADLIEITTPKSTWRWPQAYGRKETA